MINFHTELPADKDLFPGGSHDKVATAMHSYIMAPNSSQVIGLDGEFGSGKSSILTMLGSKLKASDDSYRVWLFDCEQNYQGSTKSNFIELFTEQLLKDVGTGSVEAESLAKSRDVALGREFEYTKITTSHASAWALALLASLFFSTSAFKELFKLAKPSAETLVKPVVEVSSILISVNWVALLSPVLVLLFAWLFNRNKKVGKANKKWSLLSLFRGSSEDTINEKIETAKEVTPLDLKRTLSNQLTLVTAQHYVVILDNLDRLPKDNLRSVWSDLEIFTSVASAENLTVVVPFCSNKVAAYLGADADRKYDSRDFIAKKFPVVFRAPPVITSGWKDGFKRLWEHTFQDVDAQLSEQCAQLLHRHSPMANGLVTPRLQKKYINDIATTALVVGEQINLVCIAAHILLCRYSEVPMEEILRRDGISQTFKTANEVDDATAAKYAQTQSLLEGLCGEGMEEGWQIQLLQIHFLTTSKIAIAELIDEPLLNAIESGDENKLYSLTSLFGFADAFKRYLATIPTLSVLLPVVSAAHAKHGGEWAADLMKLLNAERLQVQPKPSRGNAAFYQCVEKCIELGLDRGLISTHGKSLSDSINLRIGEPYEEAEFAVLKADLVEYDLYLNGVGETFDGMLLDRVECVMHLLPAIEEMKVIRVIDFEPSEKAYPNANLQLVSTDDHALIASPLDSDQVVPALVWAYKHRSVTEGVVGGISAAEVAEIAKLCDGGSVNAAVVCLALAETIDSTVLSTLASLLASDPTDTVRAVGAIVYMRESDPATLASIPVLDQVFVSELFWALGNAALKCTDILPLVTSEVASAIAPYIAKLIKKKKLSRLPIPWMMKNFTALTDAVGPEGVSVDEVLSWFESWDLRTEQGLKQLHEVDLNLLGLALATESVHFKNFKTFAFKVVDAPNRTEEQWCAIIVQALPQMTKIFQAIKAQGMNLSGASTIADSVVASLSQYVGGAAKFELDSATVSLLQAMIEVLDPQLKHVVGARLRSLFYSDPQQIDRLIAVLQNFASLIQDIQPINSDEASRLIRLLDSVGRTSASTDKVALFLDTKADQIGAYRYSKDLREAMVSVVAKLKNQAPRLYKKFASKKWFASLFKSSVNEETTGEV
ncbi:MULTISPECIES: P-loop NTPase fold protein [unclassified Pseudomonas]|uniref:P-loop NTPase fold protein n=1 Tax=unclassified Pseudomonas TaxID=196821 RepID=UPI000A1EA4C1|nr:MULTISPECIES: P-loop NTPase fold protein [unclassified Pseudomonas]